MVSAGGIHIPQTATQWIDKPRTGTVIAVGSEVKAVRPADNVIITQGCGLEMSFQGLGDYAPIQEYLFVKEEHLVGVIEA